MASVEPSASAKPPGSAGEFVIARTFDVPRQRMWRVWTDVEELKHWWGPKGCTVAAATLDLRPGGVFHYCLRMPDGQEMWGRFVFREVTEPERLVFVTSFSDAAGGTTRHPMAPTWPLQLLSTVTFAEAGGRTTVTVRWRPLDPTEEERQTFERGRDSMQQGWTGTFDRLGDCIARS